MTSFILWRRDQGGNVLAFYGEPRHLTGLPPSPPVIFNKTERFKRRRIYIFSFYILSVKFFWTQFKRIFSLYLQKKCNFPTLCKHYFAKIIVFLKTIIIYNIVKVFFCPIFL